MFQIGDVLSKSWEDFKNNAGLLIIALIIGMVASMAVNYGGQLMVGIVVRATKSATMAFVLMPITIILSLIAQAVIQLGWFTIHLKVIRGEAAEVGDMFSQMDKLVPAIIAQVIIGIGTMIGMVLLVIPGIAFAILSSLTMWYIVDQNMAPVDAVKASIDAVKQDWVNVLLFGLLAGVIVVVAVIPCGLGLLAAIPVLGLSMGRIYLTLSGSDNAGSSAAPTDAPA